MLQIKYVPVENAVAEWGNKDAVCKRFEGLRPKTLDALLVEMRKNPKFYLFSNNIGELTGLGFIKGTIRDNS